jgi:hypothetical protein
VDSRAIVWVRKFLVGRTQRVRVRGQLFKEVKANSEVPQGIDFGPLLSLVYVNNIWRNIDWCIRLFDDDCLIYRKITNRKDIENLLVTFYIILYMVVCFVCFCLIM